MVFTMTITHKHSQQESGISLVLRPTRRRSHRADWDKKRSQESAISLVVHTASSREMENKTVMKRWKGHQAVKLLFERIVAAREGKDLSDPGQFVMLPFPSVGNIPERFHLDTGSCFRYMGRTGYANLRHTVLGLWRRHRCDAFDTLPVRPDKHPKHFFGQAGLWGTMGSGKSFIFAALVCDLLASFSRSKEPTGFQRQRVVYLPDCQELVDNPTKKIEVFQHSLFLSYAEDVETLNRIAMLSDETSLQLFFDQEADKDVFIYLMVDQVNALEASLDDGSSHGLLKAQLYSLLRGLTYSHALGMSASANNINAKKWYKKQTNIAAVFHHGGLDDVEYNNWKKHFSLSQEGSLTPLGLLTEEQELRVRDATGCVPLFLQCWSEDPITLEEAWQSFISLREIQAAEANLVEFIEKQLHDESHKKSRLRMYLQFMTRDRVNATPDLYDCRYLYVEQSNRTGRCVCGLYRDLIAQLLEDFRRSSYVKSEWQKAIIGEVGKQNPNRSLLGFVIEQEMISEILENGIPLDARTVMKCNKVVYFTSGSEQNLVIEEGCILYVPSAFNYHRVDAVIREYQKSGSLCDGSYPPHPKDLVKIYNKLRLRIAGVQISLGNIQNHLNSENEFCTPEAMRVWYPRWDDKDVARWFIWYALQSEIDKHTSDAVELFPCVYGTGLIQGKTRAASVQGLDHVTAFFPVEQYEPILEMLRKT